MFREKRPLGSGLTVAQGSFVDNKNQNINLEYRDNLMWNNSEGVLLCVSYCVILITLNRGGSKNRKKMKGHEAGNGENSNQGYPVGRKHFRGEVLRKVKEVGSDRTHAPVESNVITLKNSRISRMGNCKKVSGKGAKVILITDDWL